MTGPEFATALFEALTSDEDTAVVRLLAMRAALSEGEAALNDDVVSARHGARGSLLMLHMANGATTEVAVSQTP